MKYRGWIGSVLLLVLVVALGGGLAAWKNAAIEENNAAAANLPEPAEAVTVAEAREREHRPTTTAIGTVLALRSITLRNEVPGTVDQVMLEPGAIVEEGTLLVALDVSVEQAELKAQEAQAALAETLLARVERARESHAVSDIEVDRARAERDVALAQSTRIEAIIDRKTIHAPFRARVGIADVHPGQYLETGTLLTTLQGVDEAAHVDFPAAQWVAARLVEGERVEIVVSGADGKSGGSGESGGDAVEAEIVAIDARVDPVTRNAMVRARIEGHGNAPAPGASVRVRVPVGPAQTAVVVPASALRKGPGGDHVFVIAVDDAGKQRARVRRVESGPLLGDEVVIHDGLEAGERVANSGSFKLREGAIVSVKDESATPTSVARRTDSLN